MQPVDKAGTGWSSRSPTRSPGTAGRERGRALGPRWQCVNPGRRAQPPAKLNLKAMKKGDRAFFYHSNEGKEIVGVVEVVREAYPDPTAEKGDWVCVDMKAVAPMPKPVTLVAIKADPAVRRSGAGAAVAAVGGAGVEAALGPDLPDGRMEAMSDGRKGPLPPTPSRKGRGRSQYWSTPPPLAGGGWGEGAARTLPHRRNPRRRRQGLPARARRLHRPVRRPPGRRGPRLCELLPPYRHAARLDARPLPLPRRQPYRLCHARRRVPHRRWRMPARPMLR